MDGSRCAKAPKKALARFVPNYVIGTVDAQLFPPEHARNIHRLLDGLLDAEDNALLGLLLELVAILRGHNRSALREAVTPQCPPPPSIIVRTLQKAL